MEKLMKLRRSKSFPHLFASMIISEEGVKTVKTIYIHKGVAEAFIPRPSEDHVYVEHIDGDYNNNRVSNLRWITASEHSIKLMEMYPENRNNLKKSNEKNGFYEKIKSKAWGKKFTISQLFKKGFSHKELAEMFDCSSSTIYNLLKTGTNKSKTNRTKKG
jgi:hypothetical protein